LSHLKKRAKISVSNFYPGDEQVTPTVELRITRNSALRQVMLAYNHAALEGVSERGTPFYERNIDRFIESHQL
jgi:hypothetical protein